MNGGGFGKAGFDGPAGYEGWEFREGSEVGGWYEGLNGGGLLKDGEGVREEDGV